MSLFFIKKRTVVWNEGDIMIVFDAFTVPDLAANKGTYILIAMYG